MAVAWQLGRNKLVAVAWQLGSNELVAIRIGRWHAVWCNVYVWAAFNVMIANSPCNKLCHAAACHHIGYMDSAFSGHLALRKSEHNLLLCRSHGHATEWVVSQLATQNRNLVTQNRNRLMCA